MFILGSCGAYSCWRLIWRSAGIKGLAGGGAKHGNAVRSRGGRRQGTGPVVAAVSRKIVNSDWQEVDEGHLPIPYR